MFESIRRHQRLMQFLLLVLIFPAFAFFGIQGYDRFFSGDGELATIGDTSITRQDFDAAQRAQREQLRQALGERYDPSMLDTPAARQRILESLIAQRALLLDAIERKIIVPDALLRETIRASGVGGEDGQFDLERYRSLLQARGQSEAAFESGVRRDLAMQMMPESIGQTVSLPAALVDGVLAFAEQAREVREIVYEPARYERGIEPDTDELSAWYDGHPQAFVVPEQANVAYLVLDEDAVRTRIEVSTEDARAWYEQNIDHFVTAEQRRASHILIRLDPDAGADARAAARAQAEDIERQLREGADFAALARAESQDPGSAAAGGDLGFFTREMMVEPFSDAAFSLNEGETSAPVETDFGFHIIRVTAIRPGVQRSFESVRADVESEIRRQLAASRFAEAAETFSNLVYEQPDSLEPAAERFGLEIHTAEVQRDGAPALASDHPLNNRRVLAAIFSHEVLERGNNSQALEAGPSRLVSVRVLQHHPEYRRTFEEVKGEVRQRVIAEQAHRLAVQAGQARIAELRAGGDSDGFGTVRTVHRSADEDFPAEAAVAVFRAATDTLPTWVGIDLGERGYSIYEIVRVIAPDEKIVRERRELWRRELQQAYAQQTIADYVATVVEKASVKRYPAMLEKDDER